MSKINILITGGAGNIGTNLCNELRSRGHHVIAADLYNTERDDYIRYMESNGFKLINEKVADYGGHLRGDPSAPLCHQDFYFFQKNKTM